MTRRPQRRFRASRAIGGVLLLALMATGCGSGDDQADGPGTTDPTEAPDSSVPSDGAEPATDDGSDTSTSTEPGAGDAPAAGEVLTSQRICDLVTGEAVSQATGVDIVDTQPAEPGKTPQCRYYFAGADRIASNATVSVLRPTEDMEGHTGAAAFQHVVQLNRQAAASTSELQTTETSLGIGDDSILFENQLLRYGVVRYGERIATIILNTSAADHGVALALAAATAPLAGS